MDTRRVAPAVPPKPRKHQASGQIPAPAVPRSCAVASALEPSYSSRLQSNSGAPLYANERLYSNVGIPGPQQVNPPPSPVSSSYSELRRAGAAAYESLYEPIEPRPPSQLSAGSGYSLYGSRGAPDREVPSVNNASLSGMSVIGNAGISVRDSEVYGVCAECGMPIVGEASGCTAMDRVYHIRCFQCRHCAVNLQGEPFYALDGDPYCEADYLDTLEKCCVCMKPILDRILRATGKPYHPGCFTCVVCNRSLDGIPFTVDATNRVHCIEDFHKKFAPRCCVCKRPIMPETGQEETVRVVALDRSFHVNCYKCEDCGLILSSEAEGRGCYPLDDHVLCKSCNAIRVQALTNGITTEL